MSLCRKDGKVTRVMMTDQQLQHVFHAVDTSGDGEISHDELIAWITGIKPTTPSVGAVEINAGSHAGSGSNRAEKKKLGELIIGIGRKPGSNLPEKKITLIIREGDQPGPVVHRLRKKYKQKLMKGQADHIVAEIKHILAKRRRGSIMVVDATTTSPKRSHKKELDHQPLNISIDSNSNSNTSLMEQDIPLHTTDINNGKPELVFGRRVSTGDRSGYIEQEILKQQGRDEIDAARERYFNSNNGNGDASAITPKTQTHTQTHTNDHWNNNNARSKNIRSDEARWNDDNKMGDEKDNDEYLSTLSSEMINSEINSCRKIQKLEIQLAKVTAENRGLKEEVIGLRAALEAYSNGL